MSELKTLAQHDAEMKERANQFFGNLRSTSAFFDPARFVVEKPNGIACPQCDAELWDDGFHPDAGSSSVFYRKTHCKGCDYHGERKAGW